MKLINSLLLTGTLLLSGFVNADTFSVDNAHVRATPPHTKNSAAFMVINNNGDKQAKLVAATSNIADRVELHSHIMSDGMMKMRQVDEIIIEANNHVELRPGSFHVMFLGLKSPLKEGENVTFNLYFDNGDEVIIDAPIKKITMQKKM